jgi:penicillin-binding protein 2
MLKDAQNIGEERFPISESTIQKITDAMYGVVNEPGGTGVQLKLAGIEFSGKSGTAQVIGYGTRDRVGKEKKFEDNAWFVGYAPRRNPEIVVSVLVQESGQHGGEAAGPVARDIIKAYYDKKAKKTQGQLTASDKRYDLGHGTAAAAAIQPPPVLKSAAASVPLPAHAASPDSQR